MIATLKRHYQVLYFFPQMHGDYQYFQQMNIGGVRVLGANLRSYDQFLAQETCDYVGSRLHGGIRALQFGKRALIIGIDHRSQEISRDTGLPVLARAQTKDLDAWIAGGGPTTLNLPWDEIANWKTCIQRQ
jgi:hypothetical protein